MTPTSTHGYNGSSQGGDPPPPPRGGGGSKKYAKSRLARYLLGSKSHAKYASRSKKDFCDFSRLRFDSVSESPGPRPKKSKKKYTKLVDDWRSGDYAIRMKIENEIKWSDLVDIEVCGGTSTVAYVTSAFSKVLNRDLTEDECELVTNKFAVEMYEMEFNRKY